MKTYKVILLHAFVKLVTTISFSQTGIATTNPDVSSILNVTSTSLRNFTIKYNNKIISMFANIRINLL